MTNDDLIAYLNQLADLIVDSCTNYEKSGVRRRHLGLARKTARRLLKMAGDIDKSSAKVHR